jgi:hypothetical protein
MRKILLLLVLVLLVSGSLFAQIRAGTTAWVSSKSAPLKSSTWFFASERGSLDMATEVSVLQVNGNWAEVRSRANSALSGWTQMSNLSSRRIVPSGTGASASEIALAGKGFNKEVEDAYRARGNLNFGDVDRVEAITVPQGELYSFVTSGRLSTGEQR